MAILTETFNSVPGGMNLALPAQEIDEAECRYLQDGLVDLPGLVRRRGPVQALAGMPTFTRKGSGFAIALDPAGEVRLAVLNGNASNGYFSALSDDLATAVDLAWPHALPPGDGATPYHIVDASPALGGGAMVGTSSAYDSNSPDQGLAFWRGGNKANYSTGTITVARGSAAVTGSGTSWLSNVSPGMWLFADTDEGYTDTLVGIVKEITSNTALILEQVSPYAITADAYTLQSLRGICPKVMKGRITCATGSTTVTGANTAWTKQGISSGDWQLYRASDLAFVGKVNSVTNDTTIVLDANAAVACTNESYVLIRADGDYNIVTTGSTEKVGFLTAVYAERQWYANQGSSHDKTYRVWFSEVDDPEGLDLAEFDGDHLLVGSTHGANTPIKKLLATYNALLIFKENETFALTGSSPTDFTIRKVADDGLFDGGSVQSFETGAIWAGRDGIYYFDGIEARNITEFKLGQYWRESLETFDPSVYRMYSMLVRNHYWLFIENLTPSEAVIKGNTSTTPTSLTVCINLPTEAVTLHTNVHMRGAVELPGDTGGRVWYIVNDSTKAIICDAIDLFDESGNDTIACDGGTTGPDFYFESRKFDAGDSLRRKLYKQLGIHYLVQGDSITVDTLIGLNNIGQTSQTTLPESVMTWDQLANTISTWDDLADEFATWDLVVASVFIPRRVKFLKRNTHFAFRLYQTSSSVTKLQLGPYQIGFKLQRVGKI